MDRLLDTLLLWSFLSTYVLLNSPLSPFYYWNVISTFGCLLSRFYTSLNWICVRARERWRWKPMNCDIFLFFFLLFFVCCCFWDSAMWRVRVSEIERDESASSQTDKTKIGNYTKRDGTVLKGTVRNYYQGQVEEQRWMTRSLAND